MRNLFLLLKGKSLLYYLTMIALVGNLLYTAFPFPPIVWRLMIVVLGLYAIVKRVGTLTKIESVLLIFAVLFFMSFLFAHSSSLTYMGSFLCIVFSLPLFIFLIEDGQIEEKDITPITIILILAATYFYIYSRYNVLTSLEVDDATINASRIFLVLLPLLFYEKRDWLFLVELFICVFFMFDAVKRGTIVAAALPVLLLLHSRFKETNRSNSKILLIITILIGCYYLWEKVINDSYFMLRLEQTMEGNDSNRSAIYQGVWRFFWSDDNHFKLFGNGYQACHELVGAMAHNDWLEILVDNGIIGALVMLIFYWQLFQSSRYALNKTSKLVLFSSLMLLLLKSLVSMVFISDTTFYVMLPIAIALYNINQPEHSSLYE